MELRVGGKAGLSANSTIDLPVASCATGRVAGHLGVVNDQSGAVLIRGRRSRC
jgi:hypothetical protein